MRIGESFAIPIRLVFLMWAAYVLDTLITWDLTLLGIYPRTFFGLTGVLFAPMLHGNLVHLISNTFPLLFLGAVLFFFMTGLQRRFSFNVIL